MRIKKILIVLILALAVLLPASYVSAEEKESDLVSVDTPKNMTVKLTYDENDVTWALVAPGGAVINKDTDTDNVTVYAGDKATYIFVGNAEAGQWKIRYDKGKNEKIGVSVNFNASDIVIDSYALGEINEKEAKATFKVSGRENAEYNYQLILTTQKNSFDGKLLTAGQGKFGENVEAIADLTKVSSFEEYYITLYVSISDGGEEVFDMRSSDKFAFVNPNEKTITKSPLFTVDYDSSCIRMDWKEALYGYSTVYVQTSLDDQELEGERVDVSEGGTRIVFAEDTKKVKVRLTAFDNDGLATVPSDYDIELSGDSAFALILPEDGLISSRIYNFSYKNAKETKVTFNVGKDKLEETLDGSGDSFIELASDNNTIDISYVIDDVTYTYHRTANVANNPVEIRLHKAIDGVTTDKDSIIIAGRTNAEALTIDGKDVEVTDGEFAVNHKLKAGENIIELIGSTGDEKTVMKLMVTCGSKTAAGAKKNIRWDYIIPLIIGLIVSVVGILLMVMKKRLPLLVWTILAGVASIALWVWFIIRSIYSHSVDFIDYALDSMKAADAYLKLNTMLMWAAIVMTCVTLLMGAMVVKKKKKT